jgi:tRNA threonylcarbamoyladenosine biosynthesis protein TsaB
MVLGIETSDILCGISFFQDGKSLIEYNLELPMQHATLVGQFVDKGLQFLSGEDRNPKYSIDDIELVSVALGPGSFTGLRIGLSYAQGFCFGKNIPIVGISNHQVLATTRPSGWNKVITIIEARRNEVYLAEHAFSDEQFSEIRNHDIVCKEDIANWMDSDTVLIYKDGLELEDELKHQIVHKAGVILSAKYSAMILARLGLEKKNRLGADDLDTLEPMYIRPFAGAH